MRSEALLLLQLEVLEHLQRILFLLERIEDQAVQSLTLEFLEQPEENFGHWLAVVLQLLEQPEHSAWAVALELPEQQEHVARAVALELPEQQEHSAWAVALEVPEQQEHVAWAVALELPEQQEHFAWAVALEVPERQEHFAWAVALELHVSQAVQEEVLLSSSDLQLLQEEDQVLGDFPDAPQEEDLHHKRVSATTPFGATGKEGQVIEPVYCSRRYLGFRVFI